MKKLLISCFVLLSWAGQAQMDSTNETIRSIYNLALSEQQGYKWLAELCSMGPRLSGSDQATASLLHFRKIIDSLGFETSLQPVTVPKWERGPQEKAWIVREGIKSEELAVCALGGSVATPEDGLEGELVEITNFNQLDSLDLKGKIAFYNIPMDPTFISTGYAYGNAVKQRWAGAIEASKRGASAVVIRSLSSSVNKYPHTGSMSYEDGVTKIPAAALSTYHAELLSRELAKNPALKLKLNMACQWYDSVESYNLIADLKGSEKPEQLILVSGHFDSWDLGTGAHDDGAGSMHALESLYLYQKLGLAHKRTLRLVFYMNEEFGLSGAKAYAKMSKEKGLQHVIAIESDGGGFSPRGFSIQSTPEMVAAVKNYRDYFEPYGIYQFASGGSGADISQLGSDDKVLIGLRPDGHRYFEVHHSALDNIKSVNARELTMGSAALTALMYLLDRDDICLNCD